MEKTILILITLLLSKLLFGQKDNNLFLKLPFDSVVFYDFGGQPEDKIISIIENNGKLSLSVRKSIKLDSETAKKFTKLLEEPNSYSSSIATCFEPHLGIVYYYFNKPVVHIDICITCNKMFSNITFKGQVRAKHDKKIGEYYALEGLSKTFRKEINTLLIKYNFSHQITELTKFDK